MLNTAKLHNFFDRVLEKDIQIPSLALSQIGAVVAVYACERASMLLTHAAFLSTIGQTSLALEYSTSAAFSFKITLLGCGILGVGLAGLSFVAISYIGKKILEKYAESKTQNLGLNSIYQKIAYISLNEVDREEAQKILVRMKEPSQIQGDPPNTVQQACEYTASVPPPKELPLHLQLQGILDKVRK